MENMQLRQRIREAFVAQSSDLWQPETGSNAWLSGKTQPHCPYHARRAHLRTSAFQVSRGYHRQPPRWADRAEPASSSRAQTA